MAAHGLKRARPAELVPGTVRVITARMDYLPRATPEGWRAISGGAWQRPDRRGGVDLRARPDYHKVLRNRLQHVADKLAATGRALRPPCLHRLRAGAGGGTGLRSGIGWRGKHTLTLHREAGSMFFLGEIYTDLPLPSPRRPRRIAATAPPASGMPDAGHRRPYRLDARRCISYLTIEHDGAIPVELRAAIGNRIYGCDDCQLVCPGTNYARRAMPTSTRARRWARPRCSAVALGRAEVHLHRTEGSAIRRIGHARWRRNLRGWRWATRCGRAWTTVLRCARRARGASELLREHIDLGAGAGLIRACAVVRARQAQPAAAHTMSQPAAPAACARAETASPNSRFTPGRSLPRTALRPHARRDCPNAQANSRNEMVWTPPPHPRGRSASGWVGASHLTASVPKWKLYQPLTKEAPP